MNSLLKFELGTYFKKPGIYIVLILLLAAGFFIGLKLSFSPSSQIYRNAPYSIANMVGLLSLTTIFITTLFSAQILFKEHDAGFGLILYSTPITKRQYLLSRFGALLIISSACFGILVTGFLIGHLADSDRADYGEFNLWFYLQPVIVLALPNILLCSALVSTVAWLGRNKLMVYLTGLFLYITYLVILTYSGSPMMAGALPQSAEALNRSAQVDPFGLSAFFQQTNAWQVSQKNTMLIQLTGNMLFNRLIYFLCSLLILFIAYFKFNFRISGSSKSKKETEKTVDDTHPATYKPLPVIIHGRAYTYAVLKNLVTQHIKILIKSIPFLLIALGLVFYLSMEFYGSIDQGIRLPEQYASTGLIANRIIYNLPGLLLLVMLFYAHELFWRSHTYRFNLIENSTPVSGNILLSSQWIALSVMMLLLTTIVMITGIIFQLIYQYPQINWPVYATLFWLINAPLMIGAALTLLLQYLVNRKWPALLVICIVMLLLATSIGKSIGITSPLLRFAAAYSARYSEMNGWDDYLRTFNWRMVFGSSLVLFLWILVTSGGYRLSKVKFARLAFPLVISLLSGWYIYTQLPSVNASAELDNRQAYERLYRTFNGANQPVITSVKTNIAIYPQHNAYQVSGKYKLINKGTTPISKLLINMDSDLQFRSVIYASPNSKQVITPKTGFVILNKPLIPGDSAMLSFLFSYKWNGFTGHQSFNAIVNNGSFVRISNYFPSFGYQADMEITSGAERRKRHLGLPSPLRRLEAPRTNNEFINLDMTISAPEEQTVIGIGNLARQWHTNKRSYYRYLSGKPIPFRFGFSSAVYRVQKVTHKGVSIAVYYDARHFENVKHLIRNAARTLDYCQANFGPYPYKIIRFAEVSSFTDGFAGTAYPATIFMTEHVLFHDNLNTGQGQDVINELAAHELSHQWWGTAQLAPDEREGSKVLTETLAMYTELIMARRYLGADAVKEKLAIHQRIYLDERGFSKEVALYKAKPEDTHLYYDKGILVMYKLTRLIGETNVNKALHNLLQKHTYPGSATVVTDLLTELYRVSDASKHDKIKQLFVDL